MPSLGIEFKHVEFHDVAAKVPGPIRRSVHECATNAVFALLFRHHHLDHKSNRALGEEFLCRDMLNANVQKSGDDIVEFGDQDDPMGVVREGRRKGGFGSLVAELRHAGSMKSLRDEFERLERLFISVHARPNLQVHTPAGFEVEQLRSSSVKARIRRRRGLIPKRG